MNYLLFSSGTLLLLYAGIQLVYRNKGALNYLVALLYGSSGLILLYSWVTRTGIIDGVRPLLNLQIPLSYSFGPSLYLAFTYMSGMKLTPNRLLFLYYLPALAALLLIVPTNLLGDPLFAKLQEPVLHAPLIPAGLSVIEVIGLFSDVYILLFLSLIIKGGMVLFRGGNLKNVKETRFLLLCIMTFFMVVISMIIGHLLHSEEMVHVTKYISSLIFILYTLFSFRYPEYTQKVIKEAKTIRYRNSQLKGIDMESLLERLHDLMRSERLYTETGLSLKSLSEKLIVTPHQLSEIINERLRMNFHAFINGYRVREAERLLREKPQMSVLEIAFAVGFNSKVSFNTHFLRQTGRRPSEYRKMKASVSPPQ